MSISTFVIIDITTAILMGITDDMSTAIVIDTQIASIFSHADEAIHIDWFICIVFGVFVLNGFDFIITTSKCIHRSCFFWCVIPTTTIQSQVQCSIGILMSTSPFCAIKNFQIDSSIRIWIGIKRSRCYILSNNVSFEVIF